MYNNFYLKDIINKDLVCLQTAETIGKIQGINFDNTLKPKNLYIKNKSENTTVYLDIKDIYSLSDVVVFEYSKSIKNIWNTLHTRHNCPIDANIYDQNGTFSGKLNDIIIYNHRTVGLNITGKHLKDFEILSVSKDTIIINTSDKKISLEEKFDLLEKIEKPNLVTLD